MDIGYFCLLLGFLVSVYAFVVSLVGRITYQPRLIRSAENGVLNVCLLVTIASTILIYAFIKDNFRIEYVASYSSRHLPLFYKISAFWAGQNGSLLFWEWLLSIFASIVVLTNKRKITQYPVHRFLPYVFSILMFTSAFLLSVLVFVSNPFAKLSFLPPDGRGLNPLLRNIGMVFHPPTLFLGYVGFAVPFAFFLGRLLALGRDTTGSDFTGNGKEDQDWLKQIRLWTLFAWFFLGIGNLLGAIWAYVELGWGGYWAWDPVENASFMPWLLGTAFLHSLMMQEKKGMFKVWNYVLIVLTFVFTVFGTFIVRSGVLSSVHAFAKSPLLGIFFLGFILFILVFSGVIFLFRRKNLSSAIPLESFLSREASFLWTNIIFVVTTFAILWGTIFPLITQAFSKQQVTVGAAFFNQVSIPIFLVLFFIIGVCPLLAWGKNGLKILFTNFFIPLICALAGGIILFLFGIRTASFGSLRMVSEAEPYALISFLLSIFVGVVIIQEFIRALLRKNFLSLFLANRRRYGALIVHLGVVLIFVGVAGSAFNSIKEVTLRKGESVEVKEYIFKYEDFRSADTPLAQVFHTVLGVYKKREDNHLEGNHLQKIATLEPEKNYDKSYDQWFAEVAVHSNLKEDIYAILGGTDPDGTNAGFKIQVNPLVLWVWLGGIVIVLGTIIVFPWSLVSLIVSAFLGVVVIIGIIIIIGLIL